ncbi:GTP-binding GTPase N-terminal [Micromonospora citrea]|uniref:GTP-binding GTPase N-terminal n=1 Tax=Micromonospora citrea TaxID=47855 RepID=A0A1C6TSP9_9ACTN|nr:hypothetical protein [Micromonospora citrea]SCL44673.1 GTP-binding GTPase N-terminal [Micromonospora citrea]
MIVVRSVLLVGLFSAKDRDHRERLDALEARVTARGWRVLGRFVQRRGVSDGGVRLMTGPLSRRFLIGTGKLEEIVANCSREHVDAVVFVNELSSYQRRWLSARLGCPALTEGDLDASAHVATGDPTRTHRRAGRGRAFRRRR